MSTEGKINHDQQGPKNITPCVIPCFPRPHLNLLICKAELIFSPNGKVFSPESPAEAGCSFPCPVSQALGRCLGTLGPGDTGPGSSGWVKSGRKKGARNLGISPVGSSLLQLSLLAPCPLALISGKSFREQQCEKYNAYNYTDMDGNLLQWVPKYAGVSPRDRCKLFCRARGRSEFKVFEAKVRVLLELRCTGGEEGPLA